MKKIWSYLNYFLIYIAYKNNKDDFIVDLDEVYEWISYSRKHKAKDVLCKRFEKTIDYMIQNDCKILLNRSVEQDMNNKKHGYNIESIKLTVSCFKMLCMIATTPQSKKICKYYISMEEVINNYIENKIEEQKKILELKDKENKKIYYNNKLFKNIIHNNN